MSLPGAYVRDFVELVRGGWNVAPETLLAGLPTELTALSDPATRVPLPVCEAIIGRAIELTGDPALAVKLGRQTRISVHGFLGFAAMTASTLRDAVDLLVRFIGTRSTAFGFELYVEGPTTSLVLEERAPLSPVIREFVVIALFVGIHELAGELSGAPLNGIGEFAFPQPDYLVGLPESECARFDCAAHRLVFASTALERPLRNADPVATRLAREQCERELAKVVNTGLPGRVRDLLDGACQVQSLETIAQQMRMSPRTLTRKLAEVGTTFSKVRDDIRHQRALLLLDIRDVSISEIATRLGYTELPNFTRAFRKWTGMTPQAYRARRPPGS